MSADLSKVRVMLVGAAGPSAQMMRTVLTLAGTTRVVAIEDSRRALEMLGTEHFDAVFVESHAELNGLPFALAARRNKAMLNPMVPIFAVYSSPRKRDIETARDLGVNDVICRPVSPKTIIEKLHAALATPRPFIAAPDFFGPDRRAEARAATFGGEDRRVRPPKKTKIQLRETL